MMLSLKKSVLGLCVAVLAAALAGCVQPVQQGGANANGGGGAATTRGRSRRPRTC